MTALPRGIRRAEVRARFCAMCPQTIDKKFALCYNKRVPETASGESLNAMLAEEW